MTKTSVLYPTLVLMRHVWQLVSQPSLALVVTKFTVSVSLYLEKIHGIMDVKEFYWIGYLSEIVH